MTSSLLLKIKSIFRTFGIDISFMKKKEGISALAHNTEENTDAFWGNPESEKTWTNPVLLKFYKILVELVKSKGIDLNGKDILDAGCGVGSLLISVNQEFAPKGNYGYEFSKKAIEIASKRFPNANYDYKNLNDEPTDKFDFIFCTEVLEHIVNPKIPLMNLLGMMRENCGLLITVPNGREDTYEGHINFWSPESWYAFIEENLKHSNFETGEIMPYGLYALIRQK